jgi:hypothetical protein
LGWLAGCLAHPKLFNVKSLGLAGWLPGRSQAVQCKKLGLAGCLADPINVKSLGWLAAWPTASFSMGAAALAAGGAGGATNGATGAATIKVNNFESINDSQ